MKTNKKFTNAVILIVSLSLFAAGCGLSKTTKGAMVGTGGGAVIGAVIGRAAGNTALGALIGATVGGVTGAVIGRKMDKQAQEIENTVPGATVYRVGEGIIVEFNDKILFAVNESNLNASAKENLSKLVTVLNKYPDTDIEVQGHTDNTGTDSYNMSLSKKRASEAANYIKERGIASSRTSIKGYGESAPNYTNDTEEGRSKNRRVEFLITANEKMVEDAKKESGN
jgi:outer membrane protein OmpA-like peptidoglycan-associated protein|tara:strand:+ start:4620 stop:5297 length:678 start_codon:yes stop_codon:yes gene_type:complete